MPARKVDPNLGYDHVVEDQVFFFLYMGNGIVYKLGYFPVKVFTGLFHELINDFNCHQTPAGKQGIVAIYVFINDLEQLSIVDRCKIASPNRSMRVTPLSISSFGPKFG